jgi:uncharacterized membrane protein YuzA (DUF378 family)
MSLPRTIADSLLIAGGLNWGAVALSDGAMNPVEQLTGGNKMAKNVIYGAVGAAALYVLADDLMNGFPRNGFRSATKLN